MFCVCVIRFLPVVLSTVVVVVVVLFLFLTKNLLFFRGERKFCLGVVKTLRRGIATPHILQPNIPQQPPTSS